MFNVTENFHAGPPVGGRLVRGMGHFAGRITSPLTGRVEVESTVGTVFDDSPEARARWSVWWRRANVEHFFSFYFLCMLSLALFSLLA